MGITLKLVSKVYLNAYTRACRVDWRRAVHQLHSKDSFVTGDFDYYLIASSLYSSKIEGNSLDADSFFRFRGNKRFPKRKEVDEIEDLVKAYRFAAEHPLNKINFLKTHALSARTLLPARSRGKIRKMPVGVRDARTLRPVYLAVEPEFVDEELNKLFDDITRLLNRKLSLRESFYYASMIHLRLAKIHPFMDGNGRSARLLEKWFLASKIGTAAWSVNSEKYYWDHRPDYYKNIALGYNYYALYWDRCVPFLLMLPEALLLSIDS